MGRPSAKDRRRSRRSSGRRQIWLPICNKSTHRLLGGLFVCADLGRVEVKGKSKPVAAWRVIGECVAQSRFEAIRPKRLTRFVGRQEQLGRLLNFWEQAKRGAGQVALLCGEPGIGKSRMSNTFLDSVAKEPHIKIRYQCSPHHINSPFFPIINQLERAAHFGREDSADIRLDKLEAMLSQAGDASLADAPLYAALLSIPSDSRYPPLNLTPQRQKELTIAALTRQLLGLVHSQPVLFLIEDVHWIDATTLETITRTIPLIRTAPVFLLITFRPEFMPPWLDHSHVMHTCHKFDREASPERRRAIVETACTALENSTRKPSPIVLTSTPLYRRNSTRTSSSWRRSRSRQR